MTRSGSSGAGAEQREADYAGAALDRDVPFAPEGLLASTTIFTPAATDLVE